MALLLLATSAAHALLLPRKHSPTDWVNYSDVKLKLHVVEGLDWRSNSEAVEKDNQLIFRQRHNRSLGTRHSRLCLGGTACRRWGLEGQIYNSGFA
jgi:hypothetical protein